jgi:hypothetical protein
LLINEHINAYIYIYTHLHTYAATHDFCRLWSSSGPTSRLTAAMDALADVFVSYESTGENFAQPIFPAQSFPSWFHTRLHTGFILGFIPRVVMSRRRPCFACVQPSKRNRTAFDVSNVLNKSLVFERIQRLNRHRASVQGKICLQQFFDLKMRPTFCIKCRTSITSGFVSGFIRGFIPPVPHPGFIPQKLRALEQIPSK